MPNILITGGTGMIGTALSRMLLEKGYTVTLLSRNSRKRKPSSGSSSSSPIAHWDLQAQTIETLADGTTNFRLTNVGGLNTKGVEVDGAA